MKRAITGLLAFSATVAALVALLYLGGRIPVGLQKGTLRRYGTLEEVRRLPELSDLPAPSYFPETIRWPASTIVAQTTPDPAVVMEFEKAGGREVVLVLSLSVSASFRPGERIVLERVEERVEHSLADRQAELEVGTCRREQPCSRIRWKEGRYFVTMTALSKPVDLLRIAGSMVPK